MLFVSFEFILFLPFIIIFYFFIPYQKRWLFLLLASYFFYAFHNPLYTIIILFSSLIDYTIGLKLGTLLDQNKRKRWLYISLISNLGILFIFKYFNFFSAEIAKFFSLFNLHYHPIIHSLALPLGISFYTFQTLSYTLDVYKKRLQPEKHFGKFALYVAFFPQLIAGPIERAKNLLSQFHFQYEFSYTRMVRGGQLILWGLFKKLVIADNLALYVNEIYGSPFEYTGLIVWISSFFFLIQLYCDFSAYSEIAMGIAIIMGIELSRNFSNSPYLTLSFSTIYSNWHITLTHWMRDYVYVFLVRKYRHKSYRKLFILLIFTIIGFWHGANWTFIVWGVMTGSFIFIDTYTNLFKVRYFFNRSVSNKGFLYAINLWLICFAAIFFRANSIEEAWFMTLNSFDLKNLNLFPTGKLPFLFSIMVIFLMEYFHILMKGKMIDGYLKTKPRNFRWCFYFIIINLILFGRAPHPPNFIYFEF